VRMEMDRSEIDDFLRERRVGVLGANRVRGAPQVLPIWYLYDGEALWMESDKAAPKVLNMRRDPGVSFCVHDEHWPYKGVVIYGKVTFIEEKIMETVQAIATRYLGKSEGKRFADQPRSYDTVLMRIAPHRFYSWDYFKG